MKKEILEALTTKFPGVSATILGRIADKLAKTAMTAEDVKTAVDGVTFQQVLESYGDSRATEAQQTAVLNYEKKHGLKDGKKVDGGKPDQQIEPDKDDDKDTPAWARAILENQKKLETRLSTIEGDKIATTRKQKLDTIIDKLPEELRKAYARTSYKDLTDEDFNTLTGEIDKEVEVLLQNEKARGAVTSRPLSNNGGNYTGKTGAKEATEAEVADVVDEGIEERYQCQCIGGIGEQGEVGDKLVFGRELGGRKIN